MLISLRFRCHFVNDWLLLAKRVLSLSFREHFALAENNRVFFAKTETEAFAPALGDSVGVPIGHRQENSKHAQVQSQN